MVVADYRRQVDVECPAVVVDAAADAVSGDAAGALRPPLRFIELALLSASETDVGVSDVPYMKRPPPSPAPPLAPAPPEPPTAWLSVTMLLVSWTVEPDGIKVGLKNAEASIAMPPPTPVPPLAPATPARQLRRCR